MSARRRTRSHADDLRGATRVVIDATEEVTKVVEAMHRTIAFSGSAQALARLAYGTVRGVAGAVGTGLDFGLDRLRPVLGASAPGRERLALLAALNGVVGDYLLETGNPLAFEMQVCQAGEPLGPRAKLHRKLLLLVHGSSMNDLQWKRAGHDHGAALARAHGFTPLYLRYNSGLHVSTNGRALAELLENLLGARVDARRTLAIVGHSMGGLVARSAVHVAETRGYAWRRALTHLVFLGTPHHGAPLERGGHWLETLLGVSRYSAPLSHLARLRSAGVTDLRYGNVLDEHWVGRDRFAFQGEQRTPLPLPHGVKCFAVAGTATRERRKSLRGDGLVPVDSALGKHARPQLALRFQRGRHFIAYGASHVDLLNRADVYEKLRGWLAC